MFVSMFLSSFVGPVISSILPSSRGFFISVLYVLALFGFFLQARLSVLNLIIER